MSSIAIPLIAPLCAIVGLFVGHWLGRRRHRGEQSFERRAAWYESAFNALSRAASLQIELQMALERRDFSGLRPITEKIDASTADVRATLDAAHMFASRAIYDAIVEAIGGLARMAPGPERVTRENTLQRTHEALEHLGRAKAAVAQEYRRHMGLSRLPAND